MVAPIEPPTPDDPIHGAGDVAGKVRPQSTGPSPTPPAEAAPEATVVDDYPNGVDTLTPSTADGKQARFRFVREIARGGMGVVSLAFDRDLLRDVAVKTIRDDFPGNAESSNRLLVEARATAQLRHPNIVTVHDVGVHEGKLFFAMDYLSGGSVARQVERISKDDPAVAVRLVEKVARAVAFAHSRNVIHRDLKPANILLDEAGEPYVSDFGLAMPLDAPVEATGTRRPLPGTPPYMSPEQAAGRTEQVGTATDVWAVGVILYELLTGARPFAGRDRDEVFKRVRENAPRPLGAVRTGLDPALQGVVDRCLKTDPRMRYGSAGDLADDLKACLPPEPRAKSVRGTAARRFGRRAAVAAVVVATCLLCLFGLRTGVAGGTKAAERPRSQLIAVERQLAAGRSAALLGGDGLPGWFQTRVGKSSLDPHPVDRRTVVFSSWERALVELLPDPPARGFRFEADVRLDGKGELGEGGLYFGGSTRAGPQGPEHWFARLIVGDCGHGGPDRLAYLYQRYRPEFEGLPSYNVEKQVRVKLLPRETGPIADAWHQLAVEVTPGKVTVFYDQQPFCETREEDFWLANKSLLYPDGPYGADFPEWFTPRGGLGLYSCKATVSYRKAVVIPLDP